MIEKTDAQISLRVSGDFKERLEKQAKMEYRTVSNLIIRILAEYLDRVEAEYAFDQ